MMTTAVATAETPPPQNAASRTPMGDSDVRGQRSAAADVPLRPQRADTGSGMMGFGVKGNVAPYKLRSSAPQPSLGTSPGRTNSCPAQTRFVSRREFLRGCRPTLPLQVAGRRPEGYGTALPWRKRGADPRDGPGPGRGTRPAFPAAWSEGAGALCAHTTSWGAGDRLNCSSPPTCPRRERHGDAPTARRRE
jgi:hypothetical protein